MVSAILDCRDLSGGGKGIRTPDLLHAMQTRYQLRHSPLFIYSPLSRRLFYLMAPTRAHANREPTSTYELHHTILMGCSPPVNTRTPHPTPLTQGSWVEQARSEAAGSAAGVNRL